MFAAGLLEALHIWACEHLQQTYSKLHDEIFMMKVFTAAYLLP